LKGPNKRTPQLSITVKVHRLTRESNPVLYDQQLRWWKNFLAKSDAQDEKRDEIKIINET